MVTNKKATHCNAGGDNLCFPTFSRCKKGKHWEEITGSEELTYALPVEFLS